MRYVISRYKSYQSDMAYRFFVTDELFYINNNLVNISGGNKLQSRFYDILHPQPEETRTSEEIIENIKSKLKKI